jgi:hypothetical protein
MVNPTKRDRGWLVVIDALRDHHPITQKDVRSESGVSCNLARVVLNGAQDKGLLYKESLQAYHFYPNLVFVVEFNGDDLRRLVRGVIADEFGDTR